MILSCCCSCCESISVSTLQHLSIINWTLSVLKVIKFLLKSLRFISFSPKKFLEIKNNYVSVTLTYIIKLLVIICTKSLV